MAEYNAIKIVKGAGGFGGPLVVKPEEGKDKLVYICAGAEPDIVSHICKLTGATPVNGFKTSVPDSEIFLVIIDCGGTLRCGIYPQKRIPTINVNPVGQSGPLAKYIVEDIYCSGVGVNEIALVEEGAEPIAAVTPEAKEEKEYTYSTDKKVSETMVESGKTNILQKFGMGCGKVIATFNQAASQAMQTVLNTILPFMAFVALLSGIINGSGFGNAFATVLKPLAGSMPGLVLLGFICSIPVLSCMLGPGAVIAQIIGVLIGNEIAKGNIEPQLALPALFAINTQCGCDFIPVGLGLAEAKPEVVEVGVPAMLYGRLLGGVPRVLVACVCSIGLYK